MHHRLFVPRDVETQTIAGGQERFAESGDVAVSKDAEHAGKERLRLPVAGRLLRDEKLNEGLTDRQTTGAHGDSPNPGPGRSYTRRSRAPRPPRDSRFSVRTHLSALR